MYFSSVVDSVVLQLISHEMYEIQIEQKTSLLF